LIGNESWCGMKKVDLEKSNELAEDIKNMEEVLSAHEKRRWIKVIFLKKLKVISPYDEDLFYSVRFQNELAEWLKQKREQYQSELDAM
jgi:hypothetical protein